MHSCFSGGSGAVFSLSTHSCDDYNTSSTRVSEGSTQSTTDKVAVKVSWKRSRTSVEKECSVLRSLEAANVPHVEQCLGINEYPNEEGRVMIALSPVVPSNGGTTSSLSNVKAGQPQKNAVKSAIETMVGMLSAGIVTVDVQPLIATETGETVFIDFTEARRIGSPMSPLDEASVVGFCAEIIALVPESLREWATEALRVLLDEMKRDGTPLTGQVLDVLESIWTD